MGEAQARADILKGMIAVERAVYGAGFFRGRADRSLAAEAAHAVLPLPRLRRHLRPARVVRRRTTSAIFGTDLWASDWVEMKPDEELKLILGRLEGPKRGMLLFHDNRQWTADMMPAFLSELKKRGYRVVHMVPGPGNGPTIDAPPGWRSETERTIGALKPRLERGPQGGRRGRSKSSRRRWNRAGRRPPATPRLPSSSQVRARRFTHLEDGAPLPPLAARLSGEDVGVIQRVAAHAPQNQGTPGDSLIFSGCRDSENRMRDMRYTPTIFSPLVEPIDRRRFDAIVARCTATLTTSRSSAGTI